MSENLGICIGKNCITVFTERQYFFIDIDNLQSSDENYFCQKKKKKKKLKFKKKIKK